MLNLIYRTFTHKIYCSGSTLLIFPNIFNAQTPNYLKFDLKLINRTQLTDVISTRLVWKIIRNQVFKHNRRLIFDSKIVRYRMYGADQLSQKKIKK